MVCDVDGFCVAAAVSDDVDALCSLDRLDEFQTPAFRYSTTAFLVTGSRCPTIPHFTAPAALPIKSKSSTLPVFAIGAVTTKNASPAPIVSLTRSVCDF